jgi:hypothetical protein
MASLDPELLRIELVTQLPVRARWIFGETPCDWDFSRAQWPLHSPSSSEFTGGDIPESWLRLRIFGEEDYADGGGAHPLLGIDYETGEVFGLDVERNALSVYILNSSVERFIVTFLLFDRVLRLRTETVLGLAGKVYEIDPGVFERSEWRDTADYVETLQKCA